MITDKDLIRRALMGNEQAQEECTEKGIVLPCWRCGGESEIQELHTGGKPIYAVTCKKTYCGAYGCAHSTKQEAIEYWNARPAPPIGRCGECRHSYINFFSASSGTALCRLWTNKAEGVQMVMQQNDFCSCFEPKEEE